MLLKLLLILAGISCVLSELLSPSLELRLNRRIRAANKLCKYGNKWSCCRGYTKNLYGQCIPRCDQGCDKGRCVGHNRCKCEKGWTGPRCDRDHNECSAQPCLHRCMNTLGSYRCYCEHGYLLMPDGRTCTKDDRCHTTRCSFGCVQHAEGFSCICPGGFKVTMDGLGCEDIDECKTGTATCPKDRRCQNTYGNYICLCPEGFKFKYVNRKFQCVDENECDANMCDPNARCHNGMGSYKCTCNVGFWGDGTTCTRIDSTTCRDGPCYPGVICTDIRLFPTDKVELTPDGAVKRFRCGMCPEGFLGTGEQCAATTVEMKVVVFESFGNQNPVHDADIKILEATSPGVTTKVTEAMTDMRGAAALRIPAASKRFILTANKQEYLPTAKSYDLRPNEDNVVVLFMSEFNEINDFTSTGTSKLFGFGGPDDGNNFRLGIPQGALDVQTRESIAVRLLDIDTSDPNSFVHVPELVGVQEVLGEKTEVQLEVFGVAELTLYSHRTGEVPPLNKPVLIVFPMDAHSDKFNPGDQIEAWYFDIDTGYWVQDGYGNIERQDQKLVWVYEAQHFTWWSAARAIDAFQCVTCKACEDLQCSRPVFGVQFLLSGLDYNYFNSLTTSSSGEVTFKFKHDAIAQVTQNCTQDKKSASGGQRLTSLGSVGNGACQELVFQVTDLKGNCPDPGDPENGARHGMAFSYGNTVSYFCDPGYTMHGSMSRVCLECGKWSGYQPFCEVDDYSSSIVADGDQGSGDFGIFG